jgi:Rod binding domain-containing protein
MKIGNGVANTPAGGAPPGHARKVARDLQAVFMNEMLKVMRETVPEGMGDGFAGETFTSMLDMEIANRMSEKLDSPLLRAIERQVNREAGQ